MKNHAILSLLCAFECVLEERPNLSDSRFDKVNEQRLKEVREVIAELEADTMKRIEEIK
jgi:hypothetical protein